MGLEFRPTGPRDIEATFAIRASTRQNPIPRSALMAMGITPESVREGFATGGLVGRVCADAGRLVGFCTGDTATGEVLVLAVLPEYEGRGIGARLLAAVAEELRSRGAKRVWLTASSDPAIRAHGFYRAQGWVPTGRKLENGDEELASPQ